MIAGTTGNNTHHSVELTKAATKTGVDAILAVVPYYSKPPQDGLLRHFGAIAEATSLPIVLYNIPGRTNVNMLPATVHELARRHPNIVAIKESSGNVEQFTALVQGRVREDFTVFSGDDYFYLPSLALGAARMYQRCWSLVRSRENSAPCTTCLRRRRDRDDRPRASA